MRFKCFFLLTGLALIIGPATGLGRSGDADNDRGGATDLGARWHQMVGDAGVWRRADVTDPHQKFIFDLVADRVQSTNGEITRDQFVQMPRHAGEAPAQDAGEATRPRADRRRNPAPEATPSAGEPGDEGGIELAGRAEAVFRGMDIDGDGLLRYDEMDDGLRAERDKWDTNKDGFIDLAEFKEYYKAQMREFRALHRPPPAPAPRATPKGKGKDKAEPPAPAPFAPDLPPNLPDWFRQYDTDGDGQIGLYEWKAAGQPIARFLEMDLNGDGFLTPDEVLWATGAAPKDPAQDPGMNNPNRAPAVSEVPAPAPAEGADAAKALEAMRLQRSLSGLKVQTRQRPNR